MESDLLNILQQKVSDIRIPWIRSIHGFKQVPIDFRPWECGLSPSALYNCSLACRKQSGMKTPEVKWMSIKRWVSLTPEGINLPEGVFLSIKRKETFITKPPSFEKKTFILLMFPYGNVWSQVKNDIPITEEWLWSDTNEKKLVFESLMRKDAAHPLNGYFKSCYDYMNKNPDQIGIHLKRKKREEPF